MEFEKAKARYQELVHVWKELPQEARDDEMLQIIVLMGPADLGIMTFDTFSAASQPMCRLFYELIRWAPGGRVAVRMFLAEVVAHDLQARTLKWLEPLAVRLATLDQGLRPNQWVGLVLTFQALDYLAPGQDWVEANLRKLAEHPEPFVAEAARRGLDLPPPGKP